MTAKEYLCQIKDVRVHIQGERERLANMKEIAMNAGSKELKQDVVQTSIKNAGLEESVGNYVDYERKIKEKIESYIELEDKISGEIYGLNCNVKLKHVLYFKYIHCLPMRQIANQMGYSVDWVKHIHSQGLKEFEEQYREMLDEV